MASGPITSWQIDGEKVETVTFYFLGLQNHCWWWLPAAMKFKRCLLLGRKAVQLLWPYRLQPTKLLSPWDSPGKNTGVGCHFLLQGIFLAQELNQPFLCLLYWQAGSLPPERFWEALDKPRQCIKKQRHHFADKGPDSQSYGFSSSHAQMWELDHKEGWQPKNWCFWTVVLEKTLQSSVDGKEIKPVNPKGNQPWIIIARTVTEADLATWWEEPTH